MSYFSALFAQREPTPVRRITMGALSRALGRKSECAPVQLDAPPAKKSESRTRSELTGASLQLRGDPAVPFLATLAPATLGGSTSSSKPQLFLAPLYEIQPFASWNAFIPFGLVLA
jgi:hypothetical protein